MLAIVSARLMQDDRQFDALVGRLREEGQEIAIYGAAPDNSGKAWIEKNDAYQVECPDGATTPLVRAECLLSFLAIAGLDREEAILLSPDPVDFSAAAVAGIAFQWEEVNV